MGILCLFPHQIALEIEPAVLNNRVAGTILQLQPTGMS